MDRSIRKSMESRACLHLFIVHKYQPRAIDLEVFLSTRSRFNMRSSIIIAVSLLAFALRAYAVGVVGSPEGFGSGTTGGGSATPVYPSTTAELKSYLEDSTARVIVLNKEYVVNHSLWG